MDVPEVSRVLWLPGGFSSREELAGGGRTGRERSLPVGPGGVGLGQLPLPTTTVPSNAQRALLAPCLVSSLCTFRLGVVMAPAGPSHLLTATRSLAHTSTESLF